MDMISDIWNVRSINRAGSPTTVTVEIAKQDNIKIDLKETQWGCMDCVHLAQDRGQRWALVNTIMNLWVP
jgi:hypothetical protein